MPRRRVTAVSPRRFGNALSEFEDFRPRARRVARRLGLATCRRSVESYIVFTPTLTGLGERAHLLHPGINASLHVADVLGVISFERLEDFVLTGHSYGGCVVSGVAEAMPNAISSIVFLDAFIPDNGDATMDLVQPAVQEVIRAALARGETTVSVRDAAAFKVNEKDRAWVDALATPQPIGTMTEKLTLTGARERVPKETYGIGISERFLRQCLRPREGRPNLVDL